MLIREPSWACAAGGGLIYRASIEWVLEDNGAWPCQVIVTVRTSTGRLSLPHEAPFTTHVPWSLFRRNISRTRVMGMACKFACRVVYSAVLILVMNSSEMPSSHAPGEQTLGPLNNQGSEFM